MSPPLIVTCPTCQRPVKWQSTSTYRPFCTERCKLIDLGIWVAPDDEPSDDTSADLTD